MKKFIALSVLAAAFTFTSCGDKKTETTTDAVATDTIVETTPEVEAATAVEVAPEVEAATTTTTTTEVK